MKGRDTSTWLVSLAVITALTVLAWPASTAVGRQLRTALHDNDLVVANEALVKFRGQPEFDEIQSETDAVENRGIGNEGVRRIRSRSLSTTALLASLRRRPDVEYAEPNYVVKADAPNDPSFGLLWGLFNTGQQIRGVVGNPGADIAADQAWLTTTGSRNNVVAVVDTGIDYTHPDLGANVWSAPGAFNVSIGGRTISCPQGSHGFNAITSSCDPRDDNNHGTHVSGTIGAAGNNGTGVVGVNWTGSIMALKFLDANGEGTTAYAISAIDFAIQARKVLGSAARVTVLSNSWGGGGYSQALLDTVNRANAAGMLFVASAGNSGRNNDVTPAYPASYQASNVVAVAATDNRDRLASFSNYGRFSVHLGAPGVDIYSTVPNGAYWWSSGTSMAVPQVSGAAALLLAGCSTLNTESLKSTLLGNVDAIPSLASTTITGGRLNVGRAMIQCSAPVLADFSLTTSPTSVTVKRGSTANVSVTVAGSGGFSSVVQLSALAPANVTARFASNTIYPGTTTLSLTPKANVKKGTYAVTVTGASGSLSHSTSFNLMVR